VIDEIEKAIAPKSSVDHFDKFCTPILSIRRAAAEQTGISKFVRKFYPVEAS
jgi:hypothetical protein